MTKPYDQDAEENGYYPGALADNLTEYLAQHGVLDHPVQRQSGTLHSIVSHLRRYWELYMAMIALLVLSFVLGYGYARETIVCETPTEDSSLAGCDYRDGGWYSE